MERFTVALPEDTARWLRHQAALSRVGASAWLAHLVERTRRRATGREEEARRRAEESRGSIGEALDRYIDAGPGLRRRLAKREDAGGAGPSSPTLQDRLYDKD